MRFVILTVVMVSLAGCGTVAVDPYAHPDEVRAMFRPGVSLNEVRHLWRSNIPEISILRPASGWGEYHAPWPETAKAAAKATKAVGRLEGFVVLNVGYCWFYYDNSDNLLFCEFVRSNPTFHLADFNPPNHDVQQSARLTVI